MAEKRVNKYSLLSGSEMVQHHTSTYEVHSQFNRLVSPDELDEPRQNDLTRMKEEFRRLLTQQRVNKSEAISEGVWENDHHRIRITRVEGKWQPYGYEDSSGKYVESYEALFLIEMNRLMVKWNDVVVSIQQGYSLFLGRPNSLSLEEYQVYSVLNRASYYVLRYDPARKYKSEENDSPSVEERCVWGNLYKMLQQPNPREMLESKANTKLYETVRRSMLKYNNLIKKPTLLNSAEKEKMDKESDEQPVNKRPKSGLQDVSHETNCFTTIEQFRRMFDRFDIIRSIMDDETCDYSNQADEEEHHTLELVFDLFAPESQTFKKSHPPLPIARIIVRKSSESMPGFRELQSVYKQQNPRVPLMLMLVSDILSVHCFLYDMKQLPRNIIVMADNSLRSK